ncbi:histidine phosphatase family protein [Allorhizocola rhizosphaerae]|uniref:histidine phosphatase family protein n=1 Tax=Allorhizocola rhizosphaerae TaxID=1872709 RepID=UPI000E3BE9D6|nr:histidine phosphatase family protein [Allorhizocola rhizosphaerae]
MTITTELTLARHGEAECNLAGRVGGDKGCTGLTARGHAQAGHLAERLRREHQRRAFEIVICSPRLRCRQTAEPIAAALDLPIMVENDLRGPDHGDADGQQWSDIKAAFGSALQHQPDKVIADGGESWNGYLARATASLEALLERHHGQRILIIGHGETVEAAHTLLLGLARDSSIRIWFTSGHAAVARWQLQVNAHGRHTWLLDAHNDQSHLPDNLR